MQEETTKGKFSHQSSRLTWSRAKPREKDYGEQNTCQTIMVASHLPSMPYQKLHNGVITLVQHLNNKATQNTSVWESEQANLTRILTVGNHDENATKIFDFPQHVLTNANNMANWASANFYTMSTVMLIIKPALHSRVIPTPLLVQGFLQLESHPLEATTRGRWCLAVGVHPVAFLSHSCWRSWGNLFFNIK